MKRTRQQGVAAAAASEAEAETRCSKNVGSNVDTLADNVRVHITHATAAAEHTTTHVVRGDEQCGVLLSTLPDLTSRVRLAGSSAHDASYLGYHVPLHTSWAALAACRGAPNTRTPSDMALPAAAVADGKEHNDDVDDIDVDNALMPSVRLEIVLCGEQARSTPICQQIPFEIGVPCRFFAEGAAFPPQGITLWKPSKAVGVDDARQPATASASSGSEDDDDDDDGTDGIDQCAINLVAMGFFEPTDVDDRRSGTDCDRQAQPPPPPPPQQQQQTSSAGTYFMGLSDAEATFRESDNRYCNTVVVTYRRDGAEPKRHAFNVYALFRALVSDRRHLDPIVRVPWTRDSIALLHQVALEPHALPFYEIDGPQFCVGADDAAGAAAAAAPSPQDIAMVLRVRAELLLLAALINIASSQNAAAVADDDDDDDDNVE